MQMILLAVSHLQTFQAFPFSAAFCWLDLQGQIYWTVSGQSVVINYKAN